MGFLQERKHMMLDYLNILEVTNEKTKHIKRYLQLDGYKNIAQLQNKEQFALNKQNITFIMITLLIFYIEKSVIKIYIVENCKFNKMH